MKVIPFKKSYYDEICEWWKAHGWDPVNERMLSTEGYVIEDNGTKIVCGWFIRTNGLTALVEWIVSNPDVSDTKVYKGLIMLENHLCKVAHELGYELIITFIENQGLKNFFNKKGWEDGDRTLSTYLKRLY